MVKDTSRQDTVVIYSIAGNARGCKLKRTHWWCLAVAFLNGKITILTQLFKGVALSIPHHAARRRSAWLSILPALLLSTLLTRTGVFAVMNGIIPALAQDGVVGYGLGAEESAW